MSQPFPYAERARHSREAHEAFLKAFSQVTHRLDQQHPATVRWHEAIQAHHRSVDAAYPPGFWDHIEALRTGDTTRADTFIGFLEADPMFFRSGYAKSQVIRYLKRLPLLDSQKARLRSVVVNLVQTRWGREIGDYARLALRIDSEQLRAQLDALTRVSDSQVRLRARRILATLPERLGGPPRYWRWVRFS